MIDREPWVLIAALMLAAPASAQAAPGATLPLDFYWDAPSDCPSGDAVRAEVERVVRVRRGRTPPHITAWARVEQRGGRWFLRLRTERAGTIGQRSLEAGACAPLVGAATLVLGLAFGEGVELSADTLVQDLRGEAEAPALAPAAPPPAPPPPPPPPAPPKQPERSEADVVVNPAPPPPRAPLNLIWALALDGRSVWGPTPGQAFGAGVGVDVGGRHWFASLRAGGVPRAEESVATNVHVRFAGLDAALSLCRRGAPARALTVAGCLGFQASALRSQAVGSSDDTPVTAPGYALLPALRIGVPLFSVVSVEAGFGLAAAIKRPAFAITGLGDVYRVPLLSPTVSVGVSVKL